MDAKSTFVHIGITVTDIDKFAEFYGAHFGFELKMRGTFPPEFIAAAPDLYRLKEGSYADFAFLAAPNGVVLELFRFNELLPAQTTVWNLPGYHHICLNVESVPDAYKAMSAAGVEFFFEPKQMGPNPGAHWVFLKDPDGNMIELQDVKI